MVKVGSVRVLQDSVVSSLRFTHLLHIFAPLFQIAGSLFDPAFLFQVGVLCMDSSLYLRESEVESLVCSMLETRSILASGLPKDMG